VGSKVVNLKKALFISAIAVFLGAFFFGHNVSKTLREEVTVFSGDNTFIVSVLLGAGLWVAFASWMGWNISTTASIVGSLVGCALLAGRSVNWFTILKIFASWITSPLIGFALSIIFVILISKTVMFFVKGFSGIERWELRLAFVQLLVAFFSLLVRASNDVAQAVFFFDAQNPQLYHLLAALGMTVGLLTFGRKVVADLGSRLTKLNPSSGLAIQLATFFSLFIFTALGIPVSGSVIFVFAFAGAGLARGQRINYSFLKQLIVSWCVTMPVTALLSGVIHLFLSFF
jgi:PiT family inorganic phosphate transporter